MPPTDGGLPEGLSASARLPVRLQARDVDAPTPFVPLLRRMIDAGGLGGLGGAHLGDDNDGEHAKPSEYLRRLHTKVDLLLWMGAELLAVHRPLPASQSVTLYPDHLHLAMNGSFEGDERQWLLLYCLEGLPLPLPLPVQVSAESEGLLCRLDAPDEDTGELYQQLLFRLHRRAVAAARSS